MSKRIIPPGKYFNPRCYLGFLKKQLTAHNIILDKLIKPVSFSELSVLQNVNVVRFNIDSDNYKIWVKQYFPRWIYRFGQLHHKKLIEFFTTFTLLDPRPEDVFMDAAGGIDTYLFDLDCKKKYVQDITISKHLKSCVRQGVEYIESDAACIPLPDESIDKISCHHSFEHFRGDSDILFIKQIQRLMKRGGKCCIVPIFIANHFVELTDRITFDMKFSNGSKRLIDPTATIPGGQASGCYARIYDLQAFQNRIIDNINGKNFKITIAELQMEGNMVPDLTLWCHRHVSAINRPYRAMIIERIL